MNIQLMKNFISICENGYNLTHVSKKLYLSQSTLSKMIDSIEEEFNIKVFIKNKGKLIGLTESGKLLFNSFKEIVDIYDNMSFALKNHKKEKIPNIKVGISSQVLEILLGNIINKLCDNNEYKVEFIETMGTELFPKFLNNEFDIILLVVGNTTPNLQYYSKRLISCEYVAIVDRGHDFAKKDKIYWEDLQRRKIALPSSGNQIYDEVMNHLNNKMIFPSSIFNISLSRVLLNITLENSIITILPEIFYNKYNQSKDIICLHFDKPKLWNIDMFILKNNKKEDSKVFKVFQQIESLVNDNMYKIR